MEHNFWHSKWKNNDIGFHEEDGNPFLKKYRHTLCDSPSARILVPLCGKTKDIGVLLSYGCQVVGVELSERAVTQLFDDLGVTPDITSEGDFTRYHQGDLTVLVGDVFALTPQHLGAITAIYDRAALVALPDAMRQDYANLLCHLAGNATQLLITFDYAQSEMSGPPFSVPQEMVEDLYQHHYLISPLTRHPIEGGLKGKVSADCLVFSLTPKPSI